MTRLDVLELIHLEFFPDSERILAMAGVSYRKDGNKIIILKIGNAGTLEQMIKHDIATPIGIIGGALSPNGRFIAAALNTASASHDTVIPDPPLLMYTVSGASLKIVYEPGKDNNRVEESTKMRVKTIKFKSTSELDIFSSSYLDPTYISWGRRFQLEDNLKENGTSTEIIIKKIRTWKHVVPMVIFEFP